MGLKESGILLGGRFSSVVPKSNKNSPKSLLPPSPPLGFPASFHSRKSDCRVNVANKGAVVAFGFDGELFSHRTADSTFQTSVNPPIYSYQSVMVESLWQIIDRFYRSLFCRQWRITTLSNLFRAGGNVLVRYLQYRSKYLFGKQKDLFE